MDHELIHDAYRAYAYFRWVDDWLDREARQKSERIAFVKRQKTLVESYHQGKQLRNITPQEQMALDMMENDKGEKRGLQTYIGNMMAVMAFDAERRNRLISQAELDAYARNLAIAVTEALHYFIGHNCASPRSEARYLAATAAHITHMLRDTLEDTAAGYFNVPREFFEIHQIDPLDVQTAPYKAWVKNRVQLARSYFNAGRGYLSQVENLRCRIAGYAYIARFERVLEAIERDGYVLRPQYRECRTFKAGAQMSWSILRSALYDQHPQTGSSVLTAR